MGQSGSKVVVQGEVAAGYESVKELFQENFDTGREESAQLCVYVGGEKVVDLWGSRSQASYTADTLTNVFSSTKSLTAIAMAALYDEGLLSYDARIADYWPEFAQKGKEKTTVADLMRHEAGLATSPHPVSIEDCLAINLRQNKVGKLIEESEQEWPEEGRRQYHGNSRGWVANEIFRRVHPEGSTIGEFLRSKVSEPLGARAFIGVREDELADYAPTAEIGLGFLFGNSLVPKALGSGVDLNFIELCALFNNFRKLMTDVKPPYKEQDFSKGIGFFYNQDIARLGENSSVNGNCSARGLAKIAAAMANGGSLGGVKVLGEKGWQALHAKPTKGSLGKGIWEVIHITQGGVAEFQGDDGHKRDGYYGWVGYGGSVFQWHPRLNIGFAFAPTLLEWHCFFNKKGARLQAEVVRCAEKLATSNNVQ